MKCNLDIGAARRIKIETKDLIYPYDDIVKRKCKKSKEAASVLNQMLLVLSSMKEDFEHRKRNLMVPFR